MLKRLAAIVRCYALIVYATVRVEGMKAANAQRHANDESPAYIEKDFTDEADYLRQIADELKKAM